MDQNQNKEKQHGVVQTFAEDMSKVLEDDKSGIIKKIIHEEEQHEIEKKNLSPESTKNRIFMLLSFLLIAISVGTLVFFFSKQEVPVVPVTPQFTPIVYLDQSAVLDVKGLDKDKIIQNILNEINATKVKKSGVEGLYLSSDKKILGLREFINLIKGNFVPGNDPFFINDNFLMGVVNGETKDFFILLKMRSTADIFDALRAWENKMFADLHGFFGFDLTPENKYLLTVCSCIA